MNTLKLTLFVLALPLLLAAQKSKEIGGFVGISQYQGDLSPSPIAANESKLALSGVYRYLFNSKFGIKGTVSWAQISGADKNKENYIRSERDWSMRSNIFELAVHSEWNFFGTERYNSTGLFNRQYTPFISLGLGAAFTNRTLTVPSEDRRKIPEPEDVTTFLVVPITAGLRLDVTQDFVVTAEFGTRATFSDYIDGVSLNGRKDTNDWYFFAGIGFVYVLEELIGGRQ